MKRKRIKAKLIPTPHPAPPRLPDFLARLKQIYKNGPVKVSGAQLITRDRGRY
jgi:hypothetical protein